ncbi:MAG: prephenate dehydrogenase [Lentihominibacter sp.]
MKTLGVAGLGLIGGSFVKAYNEREEWRVLGYDKDSRINQLAILAEDLEGELTEENIGECDLVLLCVYPEAAIEYLRRMAPYISRETVILDCCGVKESVCGPCFEIAREHGLTYLGGHPMAGRHFSGYKYATEKLFRGAPMVIVPETFDNIELLTKVKELLAPAGFGSVSVTTAEEHDRLIAFTSQLAHVVSNAYMKSPTASSHKGFSAGSYKDLTRVAWLNEDMWSELFMDNRQNLTFELDHIIDSLCEYRDALKKGDVDTLRELLKEGRIRKEETDGK